MSHQKTTGYAKFWFEVIKLLWVGNTAGFEYHHFRFPGQRSQKDTEMLYKHNINQWSEDRNLFIL